MSASGHSPQVVGHRETRYDGLPDKREHFIVDAHPEIRLFVKLKLTKCARAGDRAGLLSFYDVAA
jgi:hypothetical protein